MWKSSLKRVYKKRQGRFLPYLLIAPAIILFLIFTYYPFIKAIILSFSLTDKNGNVAKWVGISNWIRVLSKSSFWEVVGITLKMALINLFFTFLIAMIFALLANKKVRFSKIYQTMYAFWAVCAMTTWMHVGVSFIFLLVGFRNVPEELLESARLDGAGPIRRIRHIIIPIASPQIFFVLFLNIANSFRSFAQIKLLTGGGPANQTKNLIYYIYENAIINGRFETACVQAIFLFILIFIVTKIQFALEKRMVHYQ